MLQVLKLNYVSLTKKEKLKQILIIVSRQKKKKKYVNIFTNDLRNFRTEMKYFNKQNLHSCLSCLSGEY